MSAMHVKIHLGIPLYRSTPSWSVCSLIGMVIESIQSKLVTQVTPVVDLFVASARNQLVADTLNSDCTHLAMLDDDVSPPPGALEHLLGAMQVTDYPVVSAVYYSRTLQPVAFSSLDPLEYLRTVPGEGLLKLPGAGLGFCLIRRDLLERPEGQTNGVLTWFSTYHDAAGEIVGEDVDFCRKLQKLNMPVVLDCSVQCLHQKMSAVGREDHLRALEASTRV